jgi:hypothetical protein
LAAVLLLAKAPDAQAHCDTLDGPVVRDARAALAAGDPTPTLKWVRAEREAELRAAFQHTLAVRALGADARELADRFFLETLVRVHRDGEGAPYTGVKPAGAAVDPGIAASDRALESGDVDALVMLVRERAEHGLRERFARAAAAKRRAGESVEQGRAYVAAYVELMHFAERLLEAAGTDAHVHAPAGVPASEGEAHHDRGVPVGAAAHQH